MTRPVYTSAPDVCTMVKALVEGIEEFRHIDPQRVFCVRSTGAKTRAIARIHGLERIWQKVLGVRPAYVVEVIAEHYDSLGFEDRLKVIIHELLHIPSTFSGGLRPHGKYVNSRRVMQIYRKASRRGVVDRIREELTGTSSKEG